MRHVKHVVPDEFRGELALVDAMADRLRRHLSDTASDLRRLHVHGASSAVVQGHVGGLLRVDLHFEEEVVLTAELGFVTQARPDFIFRLGPGRGVIAEVERGGTITNNHDLKDLWKAHIAPDAHHLFLVVPMQNFSRDGSGREKPFPVVARRLGAFFGDSRREIDVLSVHVFGY
ncbi:hypothetical protein K8Z61_13680 [Nocardioides sp. TRM66260-LWL]|uniref:hypothetical protein n=1 Tax=Nocardioides sp. TRM66260-LWL TaxID=2874478 RepID=UPI001CC7C47B|nr:hypothetical protein [Nocardioides sp. TRM66260-LWL]MBZ5735544.1 hypothetical protein [Nocardioides sp. TRM66260-LWL]